MRPILSSVFLIITSLSIAQTPAHTDTWEQMDSLMCPKGYAAIGHPYQEFRLTSTNNVADNKSLAGKVVLINFWFEGCHPCMAEMEALNELFNKMKDNKDFVFISLTRDDEETINRVKKKYSLLFDVYYASSKECQQLNFGCGYPTSIILDKTGIVKYKHSGGSIKTEEAREFVMQTLLPEIKKLL